MTEAGVGVFASISVKVSLEQMSVVYDSAPTW